jgi:hypothetical protein
MKPTTIHHNGKVGGIKNKRGGAVIRYVVGSWWWVGERRSRNPDPTVMQEKLIDSSNC